MLEIVTIQHSFQEVINDVQDGVVDGESFWISLRVPGSNQRLHEVNLKQGKITGDIQFKMLGNNMYEVDSQYKLKTGKFFKVLGVSSVNVIGSDLLLGMKSGDLAVLNMVTKEKTTVQCHFLDIVQIQVFPSKEVVMTVGSDHQVKLWSLKDWKCIRDFKCLNSSNVELIGKGRNFVNGNMNGVVNLWECGSGKVVHEFTKIRNKNDPVTGIVVADGNEHQGEENERNKENDLEFETYNKDLIVSYSKGDIIRYDLFTKTSDHLEIHYEVSCMKVVEKYLVLGTEDGLLVIYDLAAKTVKFTKQLNDSPVLLEVKKVGGKFKVFVYNGGETLVAVTVEKWMETETIYLVGLPEFFKVVSMVYEKKLIVGSDYGVILFDV